MQLQTESARPLAEVLAAIQSLDLDPIKFKLSHPKGDRRWSREYADEVEREYRKFLTLLVKYPDEQIPPSNEVDEFWHQHILDTRKYAADCAAVFGYFLHHYPYFGLRDEDDAGDQERAATTGAALYAKEFGTQPSQALQAGWCYASVEAGKPAWCYAAITAKNPAWCYASVDAKKAAWCYATVEAKKPAWCYAAVEAKNPAWCYAAVDAKKAAWCYAAIEAKKPAWCYATVEAKNPAWCYATVEAKKAAWCYAAIEAKKPAWCYAAVEAKSAALA